MTDEADDPVGVPIDADAIRHELPEAIRHEWSGARIEIHSVFLDEPMTVRRIEALLQEAPSGPLPIPNAVQTPRTIRVMPRERTQHFFA